MRFLGAVLAPSKRNRVPCDERIMRIFPRLNLFPEASSAVFLLVTILGGASREAFADDEARRDSTTLKEIVVEGRGENLIGIAESASQGKVGREILDHRPLLRTGELLETVPGMIVTQHSGDGKANQYFLRGFNLDHGTDFRTTVDGMPVNMPTHAHGQGYMDLNFVIPELVDHIDYKKGVSYAEEGDFATAGAANMFLADALEKNTLQTSYGEYGFFRELATGSVAAGDGKLLYGLEAGYYNGPWDLKQDANRLNGQLRFVTGDKQRGSSITAMAYRSFWDSTDQIPERAVDAGLISPFGRIDPTNGGRTSRYSISGQYHDLRGDDRVRVSAYAISYQLNLFSNFTYALDYPEQGDQFEQVDRRVVFGGESSLERDSHLFGTSGTNTIGVQLRNDIIPSVALKRTSARETFLTTRDDSVYEGSVGVYAKNETVWTEKLRTTTGLRGDLYEFNVNSSNDANSGNEIAGKVSPKGGIVLGPWADTEFYGNAGLGFHSNDARGTTISVDPSTGEKSDPVNPLVLARGAEVGVRTAAIPDVNSTISLWLLDLSSELVFLGDAGLTEPNRASRRMGIELSNFYKPASWLTIDADYSASRARFREDDPAGDYVPGSINQVFTAGISTELPAGFFAGFRTRYFGPRALIEDNSARSSSTFLSNARAGYAFQNLKFTLDILNVFDSGDHDIDYFYRSRLEGEPADGFDDIHFHPVEPREFRGTLSYTF